jgi:predicted anti-sigma-YlaC factor YlaD
MRKAFGNRYACDPARSFVSLGLDDELSELEHALLDAHLGHCEACREYATSVETTTRELRAAPLVALERRIALPVARRRVYFQRIQNAAAAATAAAAALVGVVIGLDAVNFERSTQTRPVLAEPVKPMQELQILRAARPGDGPAGPDIPV